MLLIKQHETIRRSYFEKTKVWQHSHRSNIYQVVINRSLPHSICACKAELRDSSAAEGQLMRSRLSSGRSADSQSHGNHIRGERISHVRWLDQYFTKLGGTDLGQSDRDSKHVRIFSEIHLTSSYFYSTNRLSSWLNQVQSTWFETTTENAKCCLKKTLKWCRQHRVYEIQWV